MTIRIRIAKIIGTIGLVSGIADFLLWLLLFEKYEFVFEQVGFWIIVIFIPLSLIGIGLVIIDALKRTSIGLRKQRIIATLILLINIPVCILLLKLYDEIGKRSLITIVNYTNDEIEKLTIKGIDYQGKLITKELKGIPASESNYIILNKWAIHSFNVQIQLDDTTLNKELSYYRMFRNQPLLDTLIIHPDHDIEFKRAEARIFQKRMNENSP